MLALLAFPIAEISILIGLADRYGWWVMFYVIAMIVLGLQLIRDEKQLFSGRMMQSLAQNQNPAKALLGSARNIIAGILLIIPGVITDIIAVILLLMPAQKPAVTYSESTYNGQAGGFEGNYRDTHYKGGAANDDVIEGEFRRED